MTRANVETEADALAAIVRDNQALGAPEADRVRGAVATYVRAVVQDEWPRLHAAGQESPRAAAALDPCTKPFKASSREPTGRGPFTTTRSGS